MVKTVQTPTIAITLFGREVYGLAHRLDGERRRKKTAVRRRRLLRQRQDEPSRHTEPVELGDTIS